MYIVWIMLVYIFLFLVRIIKGPTVWDRLLGMNLMTTKVIIIIIALASFFDITYLLDFAIVYTLFGFICSIFIALFLMDRTRGGRK